MSSGTSTISLRCELFLQISHLTLIMFLFQEHCTLPITGLEKTSRPGHVRGHLYIVKFCDDPQLCPVFTLTEYYARVRYIQSIWVFFTHIIIQANQLSPNRQSFFISLKPPHTTVSSQTLARWATDLLSDAGVDTEIFKAHSTRAAASNLQARSLSSIQICKLADWSTTSGVYQKFYQRYAEWMIILSAVIITTSTEVPIYMNWLILFYCFNLCVAIRVSFCYEHSFESSAVSVFLFC